MSLPVQIETQCPGCHGRKTLTVDAEGYANWRRGIHIQHALSELPAADRERWAEMFGDE